MNSHIKIDKQQNQTNTASSASSSPHFRKGFINVPVNQFQLPEQLCMFDIANKQWQRKVICIKKKPSRDTKVF